MKVEGNIPIPRSIIMNDNSRLPNNNNNLHLTMMSSWNQMRFRH